MVEVPTTVPATVKSPEIDVEKAQAVIFQPNPGPQTDFLAASEQEVLYGGAAGGGKSFAIIADPVRNFNNPHFRGLLLRRTTEELRELISASKELYPKAIPGIRFLERDKTWVAPSGATLWMSYLDADDDVMRYQGQAFCVSRGTKVVLGSGDLKPIEDLVVGDFVTSLEGPKEVLWKSPKLNKPCVKVSVYSTEGLLLSSQIHPDSHPIALLSSKPWKSLYDSCRNVSKFQKSPLQWLSYIQLQSAHQGNPEIFSSEGGNQNGYKGFEGVHQEALQLRSFFYPAVRFSPLPQSDVFHASTQFCRAYKHQERSGDLHQGPSETPLDLRLLDAPSPQKRDHTSLSSHQSCGDDLDALLEMQKVEGSLESYSACSCQCDGLPHPFQGVSLSDAPSQVCAVEQDLSHLLQCGKGYTPLCNRYLSDSYSHPYTQEQRELKVPLELCIVRVEPLETPFCEVYDLNVSSSNNYITESGLVNKNCWIGFDELTQWASPYAWNYMRSRLRVTANSGLKTYMRSTTNPGGPGHAFVKKLFIDPSPPNTPFWATDIDTGEILTWPKGHSRAGEPLFKRKFIPAKLFDNPYLSSDGMYEANLLSLPEHQRKRLLEGDWDINEGAAFPEFNRHLHVVEPFEIPHAWPKFRAADYGYGSNTGVLWFTVSPAEQLIIYRELYVSKVTAWDLADMILEAESGEKIRYGVLDSSLWHNRGDRGPSLAEQMISKGCRWRPSDRSRGSRVAGKNEIHRRLQVDEFTGEAKMVIFNTCKSLISQLPSIPLDRNNPEDVDTKAEDHLYDALRYGIMSRPRSSIWDYNPMTSGERFKMSDSKFGY